MQGHFFTDCEIQQRNRLVKIQNEDEEVVNTLSYSTSMRFRLLLRLLHGMKLKQMKWIKVEVGMWMRYGDVLFFSVLIFFSLFILCK